MRKRVPRVVALSVVLILVSGAFALKPVRATHEPTVVTDASGPQYEPRTDGSTVVWADGRNRTDIPADDIFAARFSDRQDFPVLEGPGDQRTPDVYGQIVVWAETKVSSANCPNCDFDILGKNLVTGDQFVVAATKASERFPAISTPWVVWLRDGAVMARDISSMPEPITVARLPDSGIGVLAGPPAIDRDRVVWGHTALDSGHWQVLLRRLPDGEVTVVAEGVANPALAVNGVDIAGDLVVYSLGRQLFAVNLASGQSTMIASHAENPTTDGHYVFWSDYRFVLETQGERIDLHGYDLATRSAFPVAMNIGQNLYPDLENGFLVWQQDRDGDTNIHGVHISDLLPSARRPDPDTTSPDWSFFPATGHYLSFGFKDFWQQSGGLPVFGYPLTAEFSELNADTGQMHTVQYLERQRFEYHPAHVGIPYEVQLGRLGAEEGARRDLLDEAAFQPLPPSTPSPGHCLYLHETQHRVCGAFRQYWHGHGLELGDTGISFRESVALFGYPISEEYVDPELGLKVQYFERARFEYHPENPEPHRVLLGRLGVNLLMAREW